MGAGREAGEYAEQDEADQRDRDAVVVQQPLHGWHKADESQIISTIASGTMYLALNALKLVAHGRSRSSAPHLRMAPKVTPRSRWPRSRKVNIATGSRNSSVPAAITVQSVMPDPSCAGMKGGAVCAFRFVIISAKAYSFQAVMKQNTAVAAMPVAASGQHDLEESLQARVAVDQRRLLVFLRDLVDEALHQPDRKRQVEGGIENDQTNMCVDQADRRYIRNIGIATTTGGNMRVDKMKKSRSGSPAMRNRENP